MPGPSANLEYTPDQLTNLLPYGRGNTYPVSISPNGPRTANAGGPSVTLTASVGAIYIIRIPKDGTIAAVAFDATSWSVSCPIDFNAYLHGSGGTDLETGLITLGTPLYSEAPLTTNITGVGINESVIATPASFAVQAGQLIAIKAVRSGGTGTCSLGFGATSNAVGTMIGDGGSGRYQDANTLQVFRPAPINCWLKYSDGTVIGRPTSTYTAPVTLGNNMKTHNGSAVNYPGLMFRLPRRAKRLHGIQVAVSKVGSPSPCFGYIYQGSTLIATSTNSLVGTDISGGPIGGFLFNDLVLDPDIDYVLSLGVPGATNTAGAHWAFQGTAAGSGVTKGFPFDVYPAKGNPYWGITGVYSTTAPASWTAADQWTQAVAADGLPWHQIILGDV